MHIFGPWNVLFTVCVLSKHKCICVCVCVCAMDVCCIYSNLPKIGPPSKISTPPFVVAKGAFLSKVCASICAVVHAVM